MKIRNADRGYFGIGIYHSKKQVNIGTLMRSAYIFGASFIFTIGRQYTYQASDTTKSWRHVPLWHYNDIDHFLRCIPRECTIVGIEQGGTNLGEFRHPERAIYLLGAEDHGLSNDAIAACSTLISIPSVQPVSLNVSVAGSIAIADRLIKNQTVVTLT